MTENVAKRLKTEAAATAAEVKVVGTHNGHFHADEALAVWMLRQHVPEYAGARLVRTRDPALLDTCDIVVDVGGEYDPARHRYDHHQRSFATFFPGREATKLSSAGLVYLHFGRPIIARKLAAASEEDPSVGLVWEKLYAAFVEALDAHDNGVSAYDPQALAAAGLEGAARFSTGGFTLGAMVNRLNPNWNDPVPNDAAAAQRLEDERFEAASRRIGEEFDRDLDFYTRSWLPAREIVAAAFAGRTQYDAEVRILVFTGQSVPWKEQLYSLEDEQGPQQAHKTLYVLYPEKPVPGAKWRVQCVPESKDSFQSRKPLPEAWRGFRDDELSRITGIPGGVFVHAAGFIGGNTTFEGALAMAKKALEL